MNIPFVVFALPRSRTAWLSKFLTYKGWYCGHDEIRHMRDLNDVKCWLSQPCTGSAETAVAPFWRLLLKYNPDSRVVIIRRPVPEVVNSLMAIETYGFGSFHRPTLEKAMWRLDAKLAQIEQRVPSALSFTFNDLNREGACAEIFEYCLPHRHDRKHWQSLAKTNVQCSFPSMLRYVGAFRPQLMKLSSIASHTIKKDLLISQVTEKDGVKLQEESLETLFKDAVHLFAEHTVEIGEASYSLEQKNLPLMRELSAKGKTITITARCNGKMFGYAVLLMAPSLDRMNGSVATVASLYASKEMPTVGMRMLKHSLALLKERGIEEMVFKAGIHGDGARLKDLYRHFGAQLDGEIYRLNLQV